MSTITILEQTYDHSLVDKVKEFMTSTDEMIVRLKTGMVVEGLSDFVIGEIKSAEMVLIRVYDSLFEETESLYQQSPRVGDDIVFLDDTPTLCIRLLDEIRSKRAVLKAMREG